MPRTLLTMMVFILCITGTSFGWTQQSAPASSADSGVVWKICAPPPVCFSSKESKQTWADENKCQFLEDVCEQTPPEQDNKGAKSEDEGFWGSLWSGIKEGLVYGYEFVKGLLAGLKSQVSDLLDLVTNPGEIIKGLVELGKAFYDDPEGTLKTLAELLGQEAIDTITRATQCGAYDLGKVVGENVNPVVMLKLATRLTKYGEKLSDAVKVIKHDLGCASFAAGTPVMTPQGLVPIERIAAGQQVLSRNERSFADLPQTVTHTFGRIASGYRLLQTEFETFKVTEEHPLWVQGKGWTEARYVADEDVIATWNGDALVTGNEAVNQPLRVYNFSVAKTPSYFVGIGGVWVHNAKCIIPGKAEKLPNGKSVDEFEKSLVDLPAAERVAQAKKMAVDVAKTRGWTKNNKLSKQNGRDVYVGEDGYLYALDTQHGRFEKVHPKTGKHQGEVKMNLELVPNSIDTSGGHDLKVK